MGCFESKEIRDWSFQQFFKLNDWEGGLPTTSAVGIASRELRAYDWDAETSKAKVEEGVQGSFGRALQFVRPESLAMVDKEIQPVKLTHKKRVFRVPGEYKLIQDAIDSARDGDVIRVEAGRYREAIAVRKRVQLIGVGRIEDIVIEMPDDFMWGAASSATVLLEASEARLCNLTIVGSRTSCAVENMCGDLTMEGCLIRGGRSGIRVSKSASCLLRFCDIQDCHAHGIYISKQGCATLEKSHVVKCGCGILVGDLGSQCTVSGCDIDLCSQVGVMLNTSAQALIDDNNITRNAIAGICMSFSSRAVISSNRIFQNRQVGICVVEESIANISKNVVTGNGAWSIFVSESSTNTILDNNSVDSQSFEFSKDDVASQVPTHLIHAARHEFRTSGEVLNGDFKVNGTSEEQAMSQGQEQEQVEQAEVPDTEAPAPSSGSGSKRLAQEDDH
uniref:Right handed beta helix domain-containing protein n=1 Tax=Hanusia phi TaxID=3032 RepID=A0A7S0EE08_9CRYP|mmetsp:Transcript_22395/g.50465  ORF Transcript_22395/g.50465 Transcript_22395/m.50465 type:complete len:447 (+) Transcript_22395:145-1485(+)